MWANPLAIAASLFLLFFAGYALAATPKKEMPLLLEAWINGHTRHVIVEAKQLKGKLMVDSVGLATAGIKFTLAEVPKNGFIAADALPGVKMQMQESEQKLEITATQERLEAQIFELNLNTENNPSPSGRGFIGQYDLIGTVDNFNHVADTSTTGAVLGGTYFTPQGNYTANGLVERQNGTTQTVRFDTSYEKDDPTTMRRLVVGDAISGGQTWSRSIRFGGMQMATDFSLRPDISTMPLPAFFGQTALPANVDVFVNSARVFEGGVEPGPFQINNLPVITGSGEASMVVRNALGQETVVTLPFFASNQLLRPGLSSYDIDAGFVRTNYGIDSFSYRDAMAQGTYSFGVKNWLTLESHSELSQDVQLAGGGAVFSLFSYGTAHLASAFSHNNDFALGGYGAQHSLAVETEMFPLGFFGSVNATTGHYADIATIGSTPPPEMQMQVGAHAALGEYGSVATSFIDVHRKDQDNARLTTASYNRSFGGRWNFAATGFYDLTHTETVFQAFLTYSLSNGLIADSSIEGGNQTHQQQIGITKPVNPDGGVGYRLTASRGDNPLKEGDVTWIGQHGSVDGEFAARDGQQAGRLTASGGVVIMEDKIYATQRPNGSVALVETGVSGTPVYHENRQIALADEDGKALITGLAPFTANHISVDPSHYKLSTLISNMDQTVTPGRQNGVVVDFTPAEHFPAIVLLHMPDGSFPNVGAAVTIKDNPEPLVVGRHGEIFITDLRQTVHGTLDDGKSRCQFSVSPARQRGNAIPRIDSVICNPEQAAP